jgi:hypothetical protein
MAKRSRRDPLDDLPKSVANEITRERITAAQELGHAICGYYVGRSDGHESLADLHAPTEAHRETSLMGKRTKTPTDLSLRFIRCNLARRHQTLGGPTPTWPQGSSGTPGRSRRSPNCWTETC